jgi:hypothetical protein
MLDTLLGWYCKTKLGCRFDNIVFSNSIPANTTNYETTLTDAQEGTDKKNKLTGHNFVITDLYSVCTTGFVSAKVLPDNEISSKFYMQMYQPVSKTLPVPLLLMADLVVWFDNNEGHTNDVYLAFDGFWINENMLPSFTLLSELPATALMNIDLQTLAMQNILEMTAAAEGVTAPKDGWGGVAPAATTHREFCKREDSY